jgi:hypothetical protein
MPAGADELVGSLRKRKLAQSAGKEKPVLPGKFAEVSAGLAV